MDWGMKLLPPVFWQKLHTPFRQAASQPLRLRWKTANCIN